MIVRVGGLSFFEGVKIENHVLSCGGIFLKGGGLSGATKKEKILKIETFATSFMVLGPFRDRR